MPLYSYHCGQCDKESEILMRSSDTAVCPFCGSTKMEQQISRVAPELKSDGIRKAWRAQAAREGHTSNFGRNER